MPYNANGYAEPGRMILGVGDLYVNDKFVGNLRGTVTLTSTREFAFSRPGNLVADIKAEVTGEEVTLEAEFADIKIEQIRTALGIQNAVETGTLKFKTKEQIQLVGTTPVVLTKTAVGTITVSKLDRSKEYVVTTDYTFATNSVTRVPAGTIVDGEWVLVEYEYESANAMSIGFGGETRCPREFKINYRTYGCDGATAKVWELEIFRAVATTEFEMTFNERTSGDYTVYNVRFQALVDTTKPEGKNLYVWKEDV